MRGDNPAWRAYALMLWPRLETFGETRPALNEDGSPKTDDDGKAVTEWKPLNIGEMTERTIHIADRLYAAEVEAEERRRAAKDREDPDTQQEAAT